MLFWLCLIMVHSAILFDCVNVQLQYKYSWYRVLFVHWQRLSASFLTEWDTIDSLSFINICGLCIRHFDHIYFTYRLGIICSQSIPVCSNWLIIELSEKQSHYHFKFQWIKCVLKIDYTGYISLHKIQENRKLNRWSSNTYNYIINYYFYSLE